MFTIVSENHIGSIDRLASYCSFLLLLQIAADMKLFPFGTTVQPTNDRSRMIGDEVVFFISIIFTPFSLIYYGIYIY